MWSLHEWVWSHQGGLGLPGATQAAVGSSPAIPMPWEHRTAITSVGVAWGNTTICGPANCQALSGARKLKRARALALWRLVDLEEPPTTSFMCATMHRKEYHEVLSAKAILKYMLGGISQKTGKKAKQPPAHRAPSSNEDLVNVDWGGRGGGQGSGSDNDEVLTVPQSLWPSQQLGSATCRRQFLLSKSLTPSLLEPPRLGRSLMRETCAWFRSPSAGLRMPWPGLRKSRMRERQQLLHSHCHAMPLTGWFTSQNWQLSTLHCQPASCHSRTMQSLISPVGGSYSPRTFNSCALPWCCLPHMSLSLWTTTLLPLPRISSGSVRCWASRHLPTLLPQRVSLLISLPDCCWWSCSMNSPSCLMFVERNFGFLQLITDIYTMFLLPFP